MSAVRAWLERLGLGQYAELFEAEQIDLDDLRDLTEADLEKLGLPMGPRKRLLRAIAELETGAAETAAGELAVPRPQPAVARAAGPGAPAALAEQILRARASIEGERRQVTVLFADVKGSTELLQHLDPEEVGNVQDQVLSMMIEAVHRYEGTVNEVLGDGIMAIFGAPIAQEDHALRACRAALDMQQAVQRWAERGPPGSVIRAIRLRVGLNSGEVVVRAINNDLTMSYSAMGMTTHLAARMEQLARPATIQITRETLRLVRGMVEARALGELPVKGLARPVAVYELRRLGEARTRLEAAGIEGLTRFVGRTQEMALLEERFAEAAAGQGQVVTIVGDPGVGKSRVLMEFRARLGERAAWVEGRCLSFGRAMAFHPIIDLTRRNFRIEDDDPPEAVCDKVAAGIARIGPGLEAILPYMLYMLGVAPSEDPVERMDPRLRRAETFDALRQLLLRAAERKLQVVVIEDLHWSDHATREFLSFLIDSIPRGRVLVVLTLRPGHDFGLAERTYATRLVLRNLSDAEAVEMAEAVLASVDLPAELHRLVRRKGECNPFFVEELIKSLSETGAIRREGERWALGRPLDQIMVPDTIQDVLRSRIDHLQEEPRQALQLASVIGREFTQRLLYRIAELRRGTTDVLRELQAIELIYETALFPELAYMFKHALTQDVAYASLLTPRRRELHRRIGEAIEALYADRLAEHYAVLAHHFARGEDWARAVGYFAKAADHAAAAFAIQEALALCDQALDALGHLGEDERVMRQRCDLHAKKADLFVALNDFDQAHAEHERAAALAARLPDVTREGAAVAGMAFASVFAHAFDRSLAEAERARHLGRASGSRRIEAAAHCSAGMVQAVTGHLDEGRRNLTLSRRLSRIERSAFYASMSSVLLGLLHNWQADYAAALLRAEEAAELARDHQLAFPLLQVQFALGLTLTGRGDYDRALAVFNEGLMLADKLGADFIGNRLLNSLGWLYAECGDLERALEFNQKGVGTSRVRGDFETIANAQLNLGDVYLARGERKLARDYFQQVHGVARKPSTSDWMKWRYSQHLFAGLGETWLALDDPARAADHCNQCLELATRTDSKKYLARGLRLRGEIAVSRLAWDEAEEALRKALAFAKRIGNPTQLWKSHVALGRLYRETRRPRPARSSFAAAHKILDRLGRSLETPELKAGFERSLMFQSVYDQAAQR